jgi:hypothetical protein
MLVVAASCGIGELVGHRLHQKCVMEALVHEPTYGCGGAMALRAI